MVFRLFVIRCLCATIVIANRERIEMQLKETEMFKRSQHGADSMLPAQAFRSYQIDDLFKYN